MKYEWRKKEKEYYMPKEKPELVEIPEFKFFTLEGQGNPNSEAFKECGSRGIPQAFSHLIS